MKRKNLTTNITNQHEQEENSDNKFVRFVWFVVESLILDNSRKSM